MATDDPRTPDSTPGSADAVGTPPTDTGGTGQAPSAPPTSAGSGASARSGKTKVDFAGNSRTARAWTAWIIGAIILIFLLVFIIQNSSEARFQFITWHFSLPLGVAVLLAAIIGALVTALIGGARMYQMRRAVKKKNR